MFNPMVSKLGSQRPESIHCSVQTSGMWKTKLEYDQYISNISLTNDIESSWARKNIPVTKQKLTSTTAL